MKAKHTPGPWRWEFNHKHKSLHLVGGVPTYDLTIMEPIRWGMNGGTLQFRDTAHDGVNIMHKLHDRADWTEPFENREHHVKWCANIVHPDARLMAAAPDLLEALKLCAAVCSGATLSKSQLVRALEHAQAALKKATGDSQ